VRTNSKIVDAAARVCRAEGGVESGGA